MKRAREVAVAEEREPIAREEQLAHSRKMDA
jgi:hypothetical protein